MQDVASLYFAALTVFLAGAALVAVFLAAAGLAAVDLAAVDLAECAQKANTTRRQSTCAE